MEDSGWGFRIHSDLGPDEDRVPYLTIHSVSRMIPIEMIITRARLGLSTKLPSDRPEIVVAG